jgi:hypothetical protein
MRISLKSNAEYMKKTYHYLFYHLYKWYERGPSIWWSEWKASLTIEIFLFFIWLAFIVYYKVFFDPYFRLGDGKTIFLFFVLFTMLPNYFIFHHQDRWKDVVKEFDQLPRDKNRFGGWLVFLFAMLVIANLVYAFYLMSRVEWAQFR